MSKTQGEKGSSYALGAGRRTSENCSEEEEEEGQTLASKLWAPQLFQPQCQIYMTHNTTDPREITGKLSMGNAA